MKHPLYFDVETIANFDLYDAWAPTEEDTERRRNRSLNEQIKDMALQPEACRLVGMNVALGREGEPKSGWVGETSLNGTVYTEADLLALWWGWAKHCPRLVGYNINKFDLHVIRVRSALLGVRPTVDLWNLKPWDDRVIDLLERRFRGTPTDQYLSLKKIRRLLCPAVPEIYEEVAGAAGGGVETLYLRWQANSDDAEALRLLKLYGELDVWTTRWLSQMWEGFYFPPLT